MTMCAVPCEDCKFARWDYTLFRDNCGGIDYINNVIDPPYGEQFDLYCIKYRRFYIQTEITGNCKDGVSGVNNYPEICRAYYKERDEYLKQLKESKQ